MTDPACLPRTLIVCTGKDCRTSKGFAKVIRLAEATGDAETTPCQGVCHGPVIGVRCGGDVRWYEKVRSTSMRSLLTDLLDAGRAAKDLRRREVKKRRDTVRHPRRVKPLVARPSAE